MQSWLLAKPLLSEVVSEDRESRATGHPQDPAPLPGLSSPTFQALPPKLTSSNFLALYWSAPLRKLSRMMSQRTVPCRNSRGGKAQRDSLACKGQDGWNGVGSRGLDGIALGRQETRPGVESSSKGFYRLSSRPPSQLQTTVTQMGDVEGDAEGLQGTRPLPCPSGLCSL